jgi:hypothetical protein
MGANPAQNMQRVNVTEIIDVGIATEDPKIPQLVRFFR